MGRLVVAVVGLAFAPVAVGLALTSTASDPVFNGLANVGFGVALGWSYLFIPLLSSVPPVTQMNAILIALVQWTIAGVLVGRVSKARKPVAVLFIAAGTLAVGAVLTHALLHVLGFTIILEGP